MRGFWPRYRRWVLPAVLVGLPCLVAGYLVLFATRPSHQVGEISLQDAKGITHQFGLWQATPLAPLPFFDNPHSWVRYNDHTFPLHGNSFGAAPGDVLVSPDRGQAAITYRFKGSDWVLFVIDLETGQVRAVRDWGKDYESFGWQRVRWNKEGVGA